MVSADVLGMAGGAKCKFLDKAAFGIAIVSIAFVVAVPALISADGDDGRLDSRPIA